MWSAGPLPSIVRNEQTKLLATALNNVGVAALVTGVLAPMASLVFGLAASPTGRLWWLICLAWLFGGSALHLAGRFVLRRLEP